MVVCGDARLAKKCDFGCDARTKVCTNHMLLAWKDAAIKWQNERQRLARTCTLAFTKGDRTAANTFGQGVPWGLGGRQIHRLNCLSPARNGLRDCVGDARDGAREGIVDEGNSRVLALP